jgi:hypothetical protein
MVSLDKKIANSEDHPLHNKSGPPVSAAPTALDRLPAEYLGLRPRLQISRRYAALMAAAWAFVICGFVICHSEPKARKRLLDSRS